MKKIIKNVVCLAAGVCCISDVVGLPTGSYNNQYSFFQKGGNNSRFGNNNRGAINEPFINNDTSSIFANPAPFSRKNKQSGVVCQQIAGSIAEVGQLVKKSILSLDDIGEVGRLEELCQNTFAEVSRMLKVQKNKIQQQSVEADYESDEFDEDDDDSFSGGRAQQRYVPPYNLGGNVKKNTFGQVPMGMGMQGGLPSQNNGWGKLSNLNSVKKKNNMLSLLSQRQQKNPMGN
ncbi:MAG: hypothetical protein LBT90_01585, partial [Holosporaceae bacterium]|nr:hypothetical protein [Holosporaceae bacterium]